MNTYDHQIVLEQEVKTSPLVPGGPWVLCGYTSDGTYRPLAAGTWSKETSALVVSVEDDRRFRQENKQPLAQDVIERIIYLALESGIFSLESRVEL